MRTCWELQAVIARPSIRGDVSVNDDAQEESWEEEEEEEEEEERILS